MAGALENFYGWWNSNVFGPRENLRRFGQQLSRDQQAANAQSAQNLSAWGLYTPTYDTPPAAMGPESLTSPWTSMQPELVGPPAPPAAPSYPGGASYPASPEAPMAETAIDVASVGGGGGAGLPPGLSGFGGGFKRKGFGGTVDELPKPDTAEYERIAAELEAAGAASIAAQEKGIGDLKTRADEMRQREGEVDLSPLLSLSDSWFGSGLQQGYDRPETREEREAKIMELEQYVQRSRQGVTDDQIGLLRDRLGLAEKRVAAEERSIDRQAQREFQAAQMEEQRQARIQMAQIAADAKAGVKSQEERQTLLKTPELTAIGGITDFNNVLNRYEQLVKEYGVDLVGVEKQELESLYNELAVKYKEAKKLGALAGPDMGLVKGTIGKADDLGGWIRDQLAGGGGAGVLATVQQIKKTNEQDFARLDTYLNEAFPGEATSGMKGAYRRLYSSSTRSLGPRTDITSGKPVAEMTRAEKEAELRRLRGQ